MKKKHGSNIYSIGKMADIVRVPASAIRFYDEQGILKPQIKDEKTGYRYYAEDQIMRALFISEMRRLGVTVADIKRLSDERSLISERMMLAARLERIKDEFELLRFKQSYIREIIRDIDITVGCFQSAKYHEQENTPIEIKYFHSTYAITQPVFGCFYEQEKFSTTQRLLYDTCEAKRLRIAGVATSRFEDKGIGHFKKDSYKSEWILPVEKPERNVEDLTLFEEMWCVHTYHIGSYADISKQYERLISYCEEHSLEIIGPPMEEYIMSCANVCGSENYITSVLFPVAFPK